MKAASYCLLAIPKDPVALTFSSTIQRHWIAPANRIRKGVGEDAATFQPCVAGGNHRLVTLAGVTLQPQGNRNETLERAE
jgi:hypothetical protein